jgi:serine protease DegQ
MSRSLNLRTSRIAAPFVLSLSLLSSPAQAILPNTVPGMGEVPSLAPMLERVLPAVVSISSPNSDASSDPQQFYRRYFDGNDQRSTTPNNGTETLGSGVVIDAHAGHIITNDHLIAEQESMLVTFHDQRRVLAKVIGRDHQTDLALLEIPSHGLQGMRTPERDDLRVGDFVVAIGNPFGLGQTVTSGIVSALGRSNLGLEGFEEFIQTDAPINVGNSGGALVNLRGELVGINTAILAPGGGNVGIGFAIPIHMVRGVADQLARYGEVRRGYLGIGIKDVGPLEAQALGLEQAQGALVTDVEVGSPADDAGLQSGDLILAMNGENIPHATRLRNLVGLTPLAERVSIRYLRDGSRRVTTAVISPQEVSQAPGESLHPRLLGATLSGIPVGRDFQGRRSGIVVNGVDANSLAWESGLRENDVIVAINRQNVRDLAAARRALKHGANAMTLRVYRDNAAIDLLLR